MVGWHCLNIKPKDPEKSIVFNCQFDLIILASKDVFINLLPNTDVIKTLEKSNKIVMWIELNMYNVPSVTCQCLSLRKHVTLYNILLNYPNQLSVPKSFSGNVQKPILKHENDTF